jgi:hypothetical protein
MKMTKKDQIVRKNIIKDAEKTDSRKDEIVPVVNKNNK